MDTTVEGCVGTAHLQRRTTRVCAMHVTQVLAVSSSALARDSVWMIPVSVTDLLQVRDFLPV